MDDLGQLAKDIRKFARSLATSIPNNSNTRIAVKTKKLAQDYSSGTYSQTIFNRPLLLNGTLSVMMRGSGSGTGLAHPYGLGTSGSKGPRGPIPYGNPAIINKQSGVFFNSWRIIKAPVSLGPALFVENTTSYAEYLEKGTAKMIRRPLDLVLEAYIASIGTAIFQDEYEKAWNRIFN